MSDTPILEVSDVRTAFDTPGGRVVAVDGVSFVLARGATLGVVGESGSGKSMLARSILRLVDARNAVTSGVIELDGRDLASLSTRELRRVRGRTAAMIFQDPMTALNGTLTIGSQIGESLRQHLGLRGSARRDAAAELLRSVGIPDARSHLRSYPHQLSGGMRQRAMIAIALACSPELMIADEPTTALDVTMQRQVLDLLDVEQVQRSMSMILITHDLGVVSGRADHIMVMYAGRVVERAPARRLFSAPRHPYTHGLLGSIPRLSDPPGRELATIPGSPPIVLEGMVGCAFAPRCVRARPTCLEQTPTLQSESDTAPDGPGAGPGEVDAHEFACFFPHGTERGDRAARENRLDGRTATGRPLAEFVGDSGPLSAVDPIDRLTPVADPVAPRQESPR